MSKIILLTSHFPPLKGGISSFMYEIVRHLPPNDVLVIGLPTPGWEAFDAKQDFRVKRLKIPSAWNAPSSQVKFLAPYYYWELTKQSNIDYVLCDAAHHTTMLPAWLMKRTSGIPFGVFAHGLDLLRQQKRIYSPVFNSMIQSAHVIFVNSHRTGSVARDIVGVKSQKIHVVHPPVNLDLTRKASPERIRSALGLQDRKCILTVGYLVERKGHDMMIRALPEILKKIPNAHYIIVGSGGQEIHLRKLAKELIVESHITFAGYVSDDDLGSYYALCDVFAMISREIPEKGDIEGFGIVYLEANLFGKPVVAGRSGGVSDAVLDGQTGLMVDPANPLDLADAIVRILSNPGFAKYLGDMGRARVISQFSGKTLVQKILKAITL